MRCLKTMVLSGVIAAVVAITLKPLAAQEKRYAVLKAGFGLPFGAYGVNLEYRYNRFGSYVGVGYMKPQYYLEITINSSFNSAVGIKYYFFKPEDGWRPIIGIHAGWLNNYYQNSIGNTSYQSTVYGLAGICGFELCESIVSLEMSLVVDPGFAVLHPETHPSYSGKVYLTPCIGVGVNLYALRHLILDNNKNNKIENADPSDFSNNNSTGNKTDENNAFNKILLQKIATDCNDTLSFRTVKTLVRDKQEKLLAGKQIAEDAYLFVRFLQNKAITGQTLQVTYIDSSIKNIEVFVIKTSKPDQNIQTLTKLVATENIIEGSIYQTTQGKITIFYYGNERNEISIRLNDLIMVEKNKTKNSQLYYDEILICLVAEN